MIKHRLSLKHFVVFISFGTSLFTLLVVLFISSSVYNRILEKQATIVANTVSVQTFQVMRQIMSKGWSREEMLHFLLTVGKEDSRGTFKTEIFRSRLVEENFGKIENSTLTRQVEEVLKTGSRKEIKEGYLLRTIYPLKADSSCIACHRNASVNDVLGAIQVSTDISTRIIEARKKFLVYFALLSPIPILISMLIVYILNRRIKRSTGLFLNQIKSVNSIRDLTKLDMQHIDLGFSELNEILREVQKFGDTLKHVAVDRSMLDFEIKLLEKFIITSEVVRDWKEYVGKLLFEINKVVTAYTLFSIFEVEHEVYDFEVFWLHQPTDKTKDLIEKSIRSKLEEVSQKFKEFATIQFVHNVVDPSKTLHEFDHDMIELQTKSLILKTPQIGGVVGIGVQSDIARDPILSLVVDSVLTTLLNVIGSIKAIYKYTKELEYYATRDPLTHLYNQRVFWELLGYEINRAERHNYQFSVLMIDVDNFKYINDSNGHVFGDKMLVEIAGIIKSALRRGDILSRYGGDEFTVILPEAGEEQSFMIGSRILENVNSLAMETADGHPAKVTVSIGAAIFPEHGDDPKDLLVMADNMTYKAKGEGKNRLMIPTEEDVIEQFKETGEKTRIILEALEQNSIIPYFQPIVDTDTGDTNCYEVLCRIQTEMGIMSAGEFVAIAERLGIMKSMDKLLLEKIFRRIHEKQSTKTFFINISPKSLILKEYIPELMALTRKYEIDPAQIVFELTERETVRNMTLLEKFVFALKDKGFKFAIDDFGSGFSTFHYLRRFPVDVLKIEGDFIRKIATDEKDRAFVRTMAELAREFNIKTVAEYVEDEAILETVREIGITYSQGFHVGRPAAEFD